MGADKMKKESKIKIAASAAAVFLFVVFWFFDLAFFPVAKEKFPSHQTIKIGGGLSLTETAKLLKDKGAIKSAFIFNLIIKISGDEKNIKAGSYLFDKPYSAFKIAKKIISGDYGVEYGRILIKEGATLEEIGAVFEKEGFFSAEGGKKELFAIAGCCAGRVLPNYNSEELSNLVFKWKIGSQPPILEGFFFPDTYFFPKNISAKEAGELILKNFDKKIKPLFLDERTGKNFYPHTITSDNKEPQIDNRSFGAGVYDILIMASILEKEARLSEDRKIIADILWRRLAEKIPLQVDATLQYITDRNTFELTKKDLKIDSPYNTYRYKGLPPTPISNPGLDSIEAVIYPAPNSYWYYLSDKDGNLHYSESYKEHQNKKLKYLSY